VSLSTHAPFSTGEPQLPARFAPAPAESTPATTAAGALEVSTSSAAPATETLSAAHLRACFVHRNPSTVNFSVVELVDGCLRRLFRLHFHEAEATCAACGLIAHHANGRDRAGLGEQFFERTFFSVEREISDEQLPVHVSYLLPAWGQLPLIRPV
jgi:hypothetical protein